MEEKKFVISESLKNELLAIIANSQCVLPAGRIINAVDQLRELKQVEDEKKDGPQG